MSPISKSAYSLPVGALGPTATPLRRSGRGAPGGRLQLVLSDAGRSTPGRGTAQETFRAFRLKRSVRPGTASADLAAFNRGASLHRSLRRKARDVVASGPAPGRDRPRSEPLFCKARKPIRRLLDRLKPDERAAIVLRYWQDFRWMIAEITGSSLIPSDELFQGRRKMASPRPAAGLGSAKRAMSHERFGTPASGGRH
jgi:hypothetical protein